MANYTYAILGNQANPLSGVSILLSLDQFTEFTTQTTIGDITANAKCIVYADPFVQFKVFASSGSDGKLRYSTDSFITPNVCGGSYTTGNVFYSICSASENVVFAVNDVYVVKSTDGGITFTDFVAVSDINPAASSGQYIIYFPNEIIGYLILDNKLFRTFDLGATWDEITVSPLTVGEEFKDVSANTTGSLIIISGLFSYYVSTDSGSSWSVTAFVSDAASSIQKISDTEFYILEIQNPAPSRSHYTSNGGLSFTVNTLNTSGSPFVEHFLHYYDSTTLITCEENSLLRKSKNGGVSFANLLNKVWDVSIVDFICGDCPEGYNKIGNECVTTVVTEPIQVGGSLVEVKKACGPGGIVPSCSPLYGQLGLNLMPSVNTALIPYTGFGGQVSGADYSFKNSLNQTIFPEVGYSTPSTFAVASVVTNSLWQNKFSQVAVWGDGVPTNTEFCFTFCFNLLESKTYFIGIAVDNFGKIYIDNLLYFELSGSSVNIPTTPFKYWHIFPVTLSAGQHTIRMCGIDKGGPNKGIGAEVYDFPNSPDPITWFKNNCQSLTSTAPYTLFSTGDYIGEFVPDPTDPPTYRCSIDGPPITDFCSNGISCETTITIPYNPCVYQLLDCNDPENVLYTTTDVSSQIGSVVKRVGDDTCWSVIGIIDIYTMPVDITIESEFTSCAFCNPSYKLINCKDSDAVIYTTTDLSDFISPTKIIKVAEYPSECWQVGNNDKLDVEFEEITVEGEPFESCETCSPALYQLTNCYTNGSFIISDSELSSYIDSVVSLQGVPGACFTVNILNVDCLAIEALGKTAQYTTANFTGVYVDGKKQYSFTLQNIINPTDYLISWNQSLLRWEVNDITNSILIAYSVLDIINPVTDFWVREFTWNQEVTGSLSIMYCTNIIYNVSVDKVYLDCECCNNKSCD